MYKRLFAFAFVFIYCFFLSVPVYATGTFQDVVSAGGEIANFVDWIVDKGTRYVRAIQSKWLDEDICPNTGPYESSRHNFIKQHTQVDGKLGDFYVCEYCGKSAGEVLEAAESEYVGTLPATEITSDGGLIWSPTVDDISLPFIFKSENTHTVNQLPFTEMSSNVILSSVEVVNERTLKFYETWIANGRSSISIGPISFTVPVIGDYECLPGSFVSGEALTVDNQVFYVTGSYSTSFYDNPASVSISYSWPNTCRNFRLELYLPTYRVSPDLPYNVTSTSDNDTYNIGTRAASITGNYGIVNGSGNVETIGTQSIVNETNNTYYSPSTGEMQEFSSWSYDYSDRSYNLTTEQGDTVSVTYGDEYLTINEGATTTNIYYITNVSDSGNGGDSGNGSGGNYTPAHTHSYTSAVTTEPTCTRSGVRTYTCSCGASYTEAIPATGHAWEIVGQQMAQYSSSDGVLLEAPYTIYECSVCGQQYRTEDESLPPAVVGQDLDLQQASDTALSTLSGLKPLYEGYLVLLTDVFPFLPPEILQLIMFGVSSCVAIGIWKAVRR